MAQTEIYEFLKQHPKEEYTTKQLSEIFEIRLGNISANCKKLANRGFISRNTKIWPNTFAYVPKSNQ